MIRNYDGFGIVEVPPELLNAKGRNVNKGRTRYKFVIGLDTMRLLSQLPRTEWVFRSQKTELSVSVRQIERIISDAAEKVGVQRKFQTKIGSKYEVHPHVFRRYWKHQMRQGGVTDETLLDYMLGHRLSYRGTYDSYPDEDLLKAHKQAEAYLKVLS
jgi:integrase